MGYAADFERTVEPLDKRLDKIATPLREGLEKLNTTVDAVVEALEKLEGDHNKLASRVDDEANNLLSVVRALGFSPQPNPAVEKTGDSKK